MKLNNQRAERHFRHKQRQKRHTLIIKNVYYLRVEHENAHEGNSWQYVFTVVSL